MSLVTLSSGKQIEVPDEQLESLSTSNGAVTTPASGPQRASKLLAHINGAAMTIPDQAGKATGKFSNFWGVYVAPSPQWSRAKITGADIGVALCVMGYVDFFMNGQIYKAGTPESQLPPFDLILTTNPPYREVKPLPTFREYFKIVKDLRSKNTSA